MSETNQAASIGLSQLEKKFQRTAIEQLANMKTTEERLAAINDMVDKASRVMTKLNPAARVKMISEIEGVMTGVKTGEVDVGIKRGMAIRRLERASKNQNGIGSIVKQPAVGMLGKVKQAASSYSVGMGDIANAAALRNPLLGLGMDIFSSIRDVGKQRELEAQAENEYAENSIKQELENLKRGDSANDGDVEKVSDEEKVEISRTVRDEVEEIRDLLADLLVVTKNTWLNDLETTAEMERARIAQERMAREAARENKGSGVTIKSPDDVEKVGEEGDTSDIENLLLANMAKGPIGRLLSKILIPLAAIAAPIAKAGKSIVGVAKKAFFPLAIITSLWSGLKGMFGRDRELKAMIDKQDLSMTDRISSGFGALLGDIAGVVDSILSLFDIDTDLKGMVDEFVTVNLVKMFDKLKLLVTDMFEFIFNIPEKLKEMWDNMVAKLKNMLDELASDPWKFITNGFDSLLEGGKNMYDGAKEKAGRLYNEYGSGFSEDLDNIKDGMQNALDGASAGSVKGESVERSQRTQDMKPNDTGKDRGQQTNIHAPSINHNQSNVTNLVSGVRKSTDDDMIDRHRFSGNALVSQ